MYIFNRVMRLRLVLIIVALLALLSACKGTNNQAPTIDPTQTQGSVVVSSDGMATISVPQDALPDGVALTDIRVSRAPAEKSFAGPSGAPMTTYRLEPDGLELRQPANMTFTLPADNNSLPILWHISGKNVEIMEGVQTTFDEDKGVLNVSAPVRHFSVVTVELRPFIIRSDFPNDVRVDEIFRTSVTVSEYAPLAGEFGGTDVETASGGIFITYKINGQWALKDGTFTGSGVLPAKVDSAPKNEVSVNGHLSVRQSFRCPKAGYAQINYYAVLNWKADVTVDYPIDSGIADTKFTTERNTSIKAFGVPQCHAPGTPMPPTSTPIPTLVPSPTLAPPTVGPTATPRPTPTLTPSPTPTRTPTPSPTPAPRFSMKPLQATFAQPKTTYRAEFINNTGAPLLYEWSGPDCGEPRNIEGRNGTAAGTLEFTWSHPHPPCDPSTEHAHVTIRLVVQDNDYVTTCTYQGSASGTGQTCTTRKK